MKHVWKMMGSSSLWEGVKWPEHFNNRRQKTRWVHKYECMVCGQTIEKEWPQGIPKKLKASDFPDTLPCKEGIIAKVMNE